MSVRVEFAAESVPAVRRRLQTWLGEVGASVRAIEDARLVVTELVANAIRHASPLGDGMIVVAWALTGGALELAISDGGSSDGPRALDPPPHSTRGRGLAIVRSLTERWWISEHDDERTVHAVLSLS